MADLLSLSVELLRQIATVSTCSSVLNLLRVNHQLRKACNDRLVFQNIARRDLGHSPVGISDRLPWSERESILASGSLDELVRIAYAAEKGVEAALAKDNSWTLKMSKRSVSLDLSNWLPQILVLQHSAVLQIKPEMFLEVQSGSHPRSKSTVPKGDFFTVNFIISYLLLHQIQCQVSPNSIKESFDHFFAENRSKDPLNTTVDRRRPDGDSIDSLRQLVPNYGQFMEYFYATQAAPLLPALILELATVEPSSRVLDRLPVPSKIPFSSMLDMPTVFQDGANMPFNESHLKKMVNAEFLRGEWMGFYSDQRAGLHERFFDAPMHDINFIAHAPLKKTMRTERVALIVERETRGVDLHGEFSLQGYVGEHGLVHLTKEYIVHRWSWSWVGRLTPFGIVGVWGGRYDHFGGHFWIWKREWCEREFDRVE
ncbi:hypothetical protein yc1106_03929 [Curvularia clavata]|uniref:F-box domain-containing protein n=1 Tax=Curvularia clavata TaxID=95742 RepID=A0A9Q8Z7K3_CURCL|nr:hypothetical protein yc1106_03929 [Curvularia clavata]